MSDEGPILVFDGVCVLCNRSIQFVLRHDHAQRYRFATNQSAPGRKLMSTHGLDPDAPISVLLVQGETGFVESDALIRVLTDFGGAWRVLAAALRCVPLLLRNRIYRFIARHRYRWFGRRELCMIPPPDQAARFLR